MPRLFKEPASIPGLTWPTATFTDRFTIDLGGERGDLVLQYCGRGHTEGDIVAWLPDRRILFAGDLVEAQAALYTGDAFHRDWSTSTLDNVAALGAVGRVVNSNPALLRLLTSNGYIPVVACMAGDAEGHMYNVNALAFNAENKFSREAFGLLMLDTWLNRYARPAA